MSNYDVLIDANMRHLGTSLGEWSAVPISGMVEATGPQGKSVRMPEFSFPSGYAHAPTLYPSTGMDGCCELCSHPIKLVFWIQNDTRRWLMPVGSECITHFGEASGEDMMRARRVEIARALASEASTLIQDLRKIVRLDWHDLTAKCMIRDALGTFYNAAVKIPAIDNERALLAWHTNKALRLGVPFNEAYSMIRAFQPAILDLLERKAIDCENFANYRAGSYHESLANEAQLCRAIAERITLRCNSRVDTKQTVS